MTFIKFENIISKPGYVKADYQDNDTDHFIEFTLSQDIVVRNDLIAIALATLCGVKYRKVYMDIKISDTVKKSLELFLNAEVFCKEGYEDIKIKKPFENHVLNFSGGFDSISILPFLPSNTGLVSMDYGAHFSREMDVIETFTNYIVSSNILSTNFRSNSWTFMLIASILYSDLMSTKFNIWGGVFGGSALSKKNFLDNYSTPYILQAANFKSIPYTLSLTEVSTARILITSYPDIIDRSLKSLAPKDSEKRYRKQKYIEIASLRHKLPVNLPNKLNPPPQPLKVWGESLHEDFMQLYFLKYLGYEETSVAVEGIPKEAVELIDSLTLNFYDRFNTDVIKHIPTKFKRNYINTLLDYDIDPYDRADWYELKKVRDFLSKWHTLS